MINKGLALTNIRMMTNTRTPCWWWAEKGTLIDTVISLYLYNGFRNKESFAIRRDHVTLANPCASNQSPPADSPPTASTITSLSSKS